MNQASRGPIAAAATKVKEPARQGLISTTGTFLDTIFICFMTGTVLVMTDSWTGDLEGACMTSYSFSTALAEAGNYIVTVGLIFFAFTTILRNSMEMLYGIPGRGKRNPYRISLHPDCCVRRLPGPGCNLDICRYA
ncbi:alanine:cation symporter family protein [Methanosarcina sp. Z-7115]|uniref:Alanine:cation symporter family protein n=1 Tax=Methanosarcina baikalica TaxID=3073890 RepID=A0ABU2D3W2_9EURY|nr:alanine:cation symporter family protein [Methanosarcina sp. Z-7115]MDR7666626.1 alanine:cation symporter family protein [Methanosarcina sp. Z-7115]